VRAQATPAAYESSHPKQFSHIHFLAHGTAIRLRPIDSAIVLSKDAENSESFKLHARKIKHRACFRLFSGSPVENARARGVKQVAEREGFYYRHFWQIAVKPIPIPRMLTPSITSCSVSSAKSNVSNFENCI
jgi:hypothetical protein